MLMTLRPGFGDSTLTAIAVANPAGRPTAPASTPGSAHAPASPSRMPATATARPASMPAMAPHVVARFHQTERIRTGNTAEALTVSDHKNSFSGSAGAA